MVLCSSPPPILCPVQKSVLLGLVLNGIGAGIGPVITVELGKKKMVTAKRSVPSRKMFRYPMEMITHGKTKS